MGAFAVALREMGTDPEKLAGYVSLQAEQERLWTGKRLSRSISLLHARELLFARQFETIAGRVQWPVQCHGYAAKKSTQSEDIDRMLTLALSDLHIGAKMPADENPEPFDFLRAGRRLAHLAIETADYKSQYRNNTALNLGLNGDIIEGLLGHNDADNAPLAEQMVASGQFCVSLIQYLASAFPEIDVWCEPGNHGRNRISHPGRAVSSKWNSFETVLYKFIAAQCRMLPNVRFHIPRAPALIIPLFNATCLMTHGDTELKLKSPSSTGGRSSWESVLNQVRADRRYGTSPDVLVAGHFHEPDIMPFASGWGIAQGALVPSNGYARTAGFGGVCGFWIFESVLGFPVGDMRFLRVGPDQDKNSDLDHVVPQYRWE